MIKKDVHKYPSMLPLILWNFLLLAVQKTGNRISREVPRRMSKKLNIATICLSSHSSNILDTVKVGKVRLRMVKVGKIKLCRVKALISNFRPRQTSCHSSCRMKNEHYPS